jgi:glycosyltransferase involved in cell wall biosynthesis
MNLSGVILTKNEEENIADCIDLLSFCDEIVVVDDDSSDRTIEIVKNLNNPKIKVLSHQLGNNFSALRNFALDQARGNWVFFIDADERVSPELANEITAVCMPDFQGDNREGYYVQRIDHIWGRELKYGETGNIKLLRLAKKNAGKWEGNVHETWEINGKLGQLIHPLEHLPHKSISEFLRKINLYSTMRADELYKIKVKSNLLFIIGYPKLKFIKNYFFLKGYKDGTAGFVHAVIMSFHSFLVRGKLFLLWKGIKNT